MLGLPFWAGSVLVWGLGLSSRNLSDLMTSALSYLFVVIFDEICSLAAVSQAPTLL